MSDRQLHRATKWSEKVAQLCCLSDIALKPITHSPDFGAKSRRRSAPKSGLCVIGFRVSMALNTIDICHISVISIGNVH